MCLVMLFAPAGPSVLNLNLRLNANVKTLPVNGARGARGASSESPTECNLRRPQGDKRRPAAPGRSSTTRSRGLRSGRGWPRQAKANASMTCRRAELNPCSMLDCSLSHQPPHVARNSTQLLSLLCLCKATLQSAVSPTMPSDAFPVGEYRLLWSIIAHCRILHQGDHYQPRNPEHMALEATPDASACPNYAAIEADRQGIAATTRLPRCHVHRGLQGKSRMDGSA